MSRLISARGALHSDFIDINKAKKLQNLEALERIKTGFGKKGGPAAFGNSIRKQQKKSSPTSKVRVEK